MIEYNENRVIDLTPNENVDTTKQQVTENPVIMIERESVEPSSNRSDKKKKTKRILAACAIMLVLGAIALGGYRYYLRHYYVGMPVSCSPSDNIEKLKAQTQRHTTPEVIMTSDRIGSVAINMYELRNLRAELTFQTPDSTDTDVYFYSRSADYDKNGNILGSMVINGKEYSDDNVRLGYCAMVGNKTVIGIARSEAVRDYVKEQGGSFFRQFILVSDGEIPRKFHLHKKVERRALARMDNQLYYIESRHAETMYDFADAIRKYGFIDAIYITGGKSPSYYRTSDGELHKIGNTKQQLPKQNLKYAPYIVFKKI